MELHDKVKQLKQHVNLSAARKAELKGTLMLQVLRKKEGIFTNLFKPMPIFASLLAVVLLGGGASAAAQTATPGSILYPVKVNLNEKVSAAFALNAETKADKEVAFAENRLEEATELAAKGELKADVQAKLEAKFAKHADNVEARIAELEAKGNGVAAADVASRFEASLKAHDAILARLSTRSSSTDQSVKPLDAKVKEKLNTAVKVRGDIDEKVKNASTSVKVEVGVRGRLHAAESVITASERFIEHKRAQFGASSTVSAEAQLRVAQDLVVQANAKIAAKAYGEAFVLAGEAIRTAQSTRFLIRANAKGMMDATDADKNTSSSNKGNGSTNSSGNANANADAKLRTNSDNGQLQLDVKEDIDSKLDSLLQVGL